jgi:hypothetical protein
MSRADELWAKAAECAKQAEAARSPEAKRTFQEAAAEWRLLAAHTERQERGPLKPADFFDSPASRSQSSEEDR